MKRSLLVVGCSVTLVTFLVGTADAKPKKPKKDEPTMSFEPEETGQPPATTTAPPPATTKPTKADKTKAATKKAASAPAVAGTASKTLDRAIKLYEGEDYYSASIELNKVVEGQSGDDEGNKQRAEFYMGKALFQLKYYSAALSYFDRIVQKGPEHGYYSKTLQWLASLSQFLPESAGVLDKIGKYTREDLEQPALEPVRDQLFYLLGRYHYTKSNFKESLDLFDAVPDKSEYYAKAKFFSGMTHVRQYKAKEAADAFKAILRKAIEHPDKATKEFEQLANLSLARTFYSLKQYDKATKYFDKIPQDSPDWLPSLFESAWAQYMMDGASKSLGNIHTLNAPYFENEFYPESLILKAVVYFERCQFDRAMEAVAEFNESFPGLKKEVDAVLAKYPEDDKFYDYVLKIQAGEAGLSDRVQRAATGALADKTLGKTIDYVTELDRELKAVEKADPAWRSTAIASTILQDLTLQKSLAAGEAGKLARERLKRLSTEIQELVKQAIKVEYETLNKQKTELNLVGKGGVVPRGTERPDKGGTVVIDDEHERWPFDGEYWMDELGYYRFKVINKCAAEAPVSKPKSDGKGETPASTPTPAATPGDKPAELPPTN